MSEALGLIETVGLSAAAAALDAAADNADVKLSGYEKVIGVGKSVSITINLVGEVASVQSAVECGVKAAEKVGIVLSSRIIPRPHEDVNKLMEMFSENIKETKKIEDTSEEEINKGNTDINECLNREN